MGYIITKTVPIPNPIGLTITGQQVEGIFETEAAANAEKGGATDLTVRNVPDNKLSGVEIFHFWHVGDTFTVTGLSTSQKDHLDRYEHAIERLKLIESQPVGFWATEDNKPATVTIAGVEKKQTRAESYGAWAKMLSRAVAVSANLTDNTRWGILKGELNIDPRTWYWLHSLSAWTGYNLDTFHITTGSSTTPDSRAGSSQPSVTLADVEGGIAKQTQ